MSVGERKAQVLALVLEKQAAPRPHTGVMSALGKLKEHIPLLSSSPTLSKMRTAFGEGSVVAKATREAKDMGLPDAPTKMYRVRRDGRKVWATKDELTKGERKKRKKLKSDSRNPTQSYVERHRSDYRASREHLDNPAQVERRERRQSAQDAQDARREGKKQSKDRFGNRNLALTVGATGVAGAGLLGGYGMYRKKLGEAEDA